ncbi:MAG TPA: FISUMP domain-containing protein, partial [Candidatus Cloacimonadota bacterium]|nr:FISUMP domain-containing protein [Candidatus Cloacimonadota bacterium]
FDYTHYEHTRYFMFKNSFGVFEVLRTTGLMTTVDDYSRQSASAQVEYDYETDEREEKSIQNIEQQKFKVAAGWLSKFADATQYRNWLRDFSLSKEVYLVDGEVLKPIELTDTSLDHSKDRDTLATFSFEFINAFTDEYYSESEEEEEASDLIPEVNAGLYGLLYNHHALVDARNIAAAGWHVSTTVDWSDLIEALGGTVASGYYANTPNEVGGKLKQTGIQFWQTPNTGATNESRFHARAPGYRVGATGNFVAFQQMATFWGLDTALQACQYYMMYNTGELSSQMLAGNDFRCGFSVRLVKDSTSLLPGQTGIYTGNDGKQYVSICIGTKEWLLYNLSETKFRNGDSIAEVTGNAEWAALNTPALCAPNNYWGYVSDLSAAQEAFSEDFSNDFKIYEN